MRFLLIQTAFIGDVVLFTSVIETLANQYPDAEIDIVVKKGNESILDGNPNINNIFAFNKKSKIKEFIRFKRWVGEEAYDYVLNFQRFASSSVLSLIAKSKESRCFDKNPLSFLFTKKYPHYFGVKGIHEIHRNFSMISDLINSDSPINPKIYPKSYSLPFEGDYICIAPASVWYTKQLPAHKFNLLAKELSQKFHIVLLGAPSDFALCEKVAQGIGANRFTILAGETSLLESASVIKGAKLTYVNDSGPMHLASATNANVCAIYLSTILDFGFGPLSQNSFVVEYEDSLACKPCGVHGFNKCPKDNFKCSEISLNQLLEPLSSIC